MVEHRPFKAVVVGSSPTVLTKFPQMRIEGARSRLFHRNREIRWYRKTARLRGALWARL